MNSMLRKFSILMFTLFLAGFFQACKGGSIIVDDIQPACNTALLRGLKAQEICPTPTETQEQETEQETEEEATDPVCGNGIVETGEDCDTAGESETCNDDCTAVFCGDTVVNLAAGEECDEGEANSDVTPNACREDCTNPICGDFVVDDGEECDRETGCNEDCQIDLGNCCETDHGAGCEVEDIEVCVCAADPFCCDIDWDGICVNEVLIVCDVNFCEE